MARFVLVFIALAQIAFAQQVRGRIVDAEGSPVARVCVGNFWKFPEPVEHVAQPPLAMEGSGTMMTSDDGSFAGEMNGQVALAYDADRKRGAFILLQSAESVQARLVALVEARGTFDVHAAGDSPQEIAAWVAPATQSGLLAVCITKSREFAFRLPPGEYRLHVSTDLIGIWSGIRALDRMIRVEAGSKAIDLGAVRLDLPKITRVRGRVESSDGVGAFDVQIGSNWTVRDQLMFPGRGATSDSEGRFEFVLDGDSSGVPLVFMAFDRERLRGGIAVLADTAKALSGPIRLRPTVRVLGAIAKQGADGAHQWRSCSIGILPEEVRVLHWASENPRFEFRLPPGKYRLTASGQDALDSTYEMDLTTGAVERDLGTITLEPTVIARNVGKEAMPWTLSDARGIDKSTKLADLKGKWVLIEFWGFW
jgi:hypothetical protein